MEIVSSRRLMTSVARKVREKGQTIGLVPTMGALHKGHLSLVHKARAMCDVVVVSVFVNPTQFGPAEDFGSYPRDLTRDTSLLTEHNVDYVFAPAVEEIYPSGYSSHVIVEGLSDQLEGKARPGHFRGVATIVAILLNTVNPDFAFFGQKDAQQVALIKKMVRDLGFGAEIVVLPIVREDSGLAMSSRNAYLSEAERRAAKVLSDGLARAAAAYDGGERGAEQLIEIVRATIEAEPLARIDYVNVNDAESLESVEKIDERPALLSLAVFIGKTRLIDNVMLGAARKQDATGAGANSAKTS